MECLLGKVQAKRCQGGDSRSSSAGSAPEPVARNRHPVVKLLSNSYYSTVFAGELVNLESLLVLNIKKKTLVQCGRSFR